MQAVTGRRQVGKTTLVQAVSFLAAVIVVFGGLYLIDRYAGWKPVGKSTRIPEIKGSVGAVSPIENPRTEGAEPSSGQSAAGSHATTGKSR
jgi:hypothetical protein